ncbi:MAG: hypothetical protein IJE15_06695 [Bacteroidaceae bacterium]|nr:hypothetical protein [Bacteroidaceae bacterium]
MKKFFVSLVMLLSLSAANVFAQSSLIATLSHEGEVSMFYGASALQQAHEAAAHGDVITLSSGTFTSVNISKAITLRGAGMDTDVTTNTFPTIIAGDFFICICDTVTAKLTIEGIYHNQRIIIDQTPTLNCSLTNATFLRCRLNDFGFSYVPVLTNVKFVHCKIENLDLGQIASTNSTLSFINSYVCSPSTRSSSTVTMEFTNCILAYYRANFSVSSIGSAILKNCIIRGVTGEEGYYGAYSYLTTAYNCISVSCGPNPWKDMTNNTNHVANFNEVFSNWDTFELTDEAKTKYLGLDGTEVGIYGGNFPFDPKTSAPQITKFNVAAKSTVDGKLSVDIEVKGVE